MSGTEQKVHHIAIFDHIFFTFRTHLARVFGALLTFELDEVIERNGLRADLALFKIGVNHTGGLRAGVSYAYGPGAHFFHARSEIGL